MDDPHLAAGTVLRGPDDPVGRRAGRGRGGDPASLLRQTRVTHLRGGRSVSLNRRDGLSQPPRERVTFATLR
jgi:hypothetical protein